MPVVHDLPAVATHDGPPLVATELMEAGTTPETTRVRRATVADVPAILALVSANFAAGHLLPRNEADVTSRAARFLVVETEDGVVGCAELAPLSRAVAEVRSLVVDASHRGRGFGSHIVEELQRWARQDGFSTLCAFTHHPGHFVRLGFSIVPHQWLPEKIATDCVGCPKFRRCTQYAMAMALRGQAIRATAAGQRPYLALPPHVVAATGHEGRLLAVLGAPAAAREQ